MPDFQILKITINKASPSSKIYFRRELVGSRSLGGDLSPPYPKEKIANDHANKIKTSGKNATLLDRAAAEAETIDVEILYRDELRESTEKHANLAKREAIAKFKEDNHDWPMRLLNIQFALDEK